MLEFPIIQSDFFGKEKIVIYSGPFVIEFEQGCVEVTGELYMTFRYTNNLMFLATTEKIDINAYTHSERFKVMTPTGLQGEVMTKGGTLNLRGKSHLQGTLKNLYSVDQSKSMDRFEIHVVNWNKNLKGYNVRYQAVQIPTHVPLIIGDWKVGLQAGYDMAVEKLINNAEEWEFALTHILEIRQIDDSLFSREEVQEVIDTLYQGFTFVSGQRVGFPIERGYLKGEKVTEEYKKVYIDRYGQKINWFQHQGVPALTEFLPLLHKKFEDNYLKTALTRSIHWLVESHSTTFVGQPVVSTQIALETIWWVILTRLSNSPLKDKEYESLSAAFRKMQEMARIMQWDTNFPKFDKLSLEGTDITNFPILFTRYRNRLSHPKPNVLFEEMSPHDQYIIGKAGLLYAELGILYIIGYQGYFMDYAEITERMVQQVPWADKAVK